MNESDLLDAVTPNTSQLWGLPVNLSIVWVTAAAAAVVIGVALWIRARLTSGVPGRVQLMLEAIVAAADRRVEAATGRTHTLAVPLALSLFVFILAANAARVLPGSASLMSTSTPTADINLTAALAVTVAVVVHVAAVRSRGFRGDFRHYLQPYWWLLPVNVIEQVVRPLTLALRLFGTAFAGGLVVALIGELIPSPAAPVPHVIWGLFDISVAVLQAVIFALLALFYYESTVGPGQGDQRRDVAFSR